MPDTLAHALKKAVGPHPVEDLGIDLHHAIDRAARELERAASYIRHDADDVFGKAFKALNTAADALAEEMRGRAAIATDTATKDIKAHPMAAAVVVAMAAAALAGLVVAARGQTPAAKA